jgi:ferric-dicitrate binding protein FerR (iron transport regulator)
MPNHDYENLLARYFAGEASAEERAALTAWRTASLENEAAFTALEKVWNETGVEPRPVIPNIDRAWQELEAKLGLPQAQARGRILEMKKPERRASFEHLLAWRSRSGMLAAAAVLLLTFSALLYKSWRDSPALQTVITANAEQRKVELSDGSLVTLNSGSTLEYPKTFSGSAREVKLAGEAFFEAAHDAAHPFLVNTANAQIKVLGTKFGIWSRAEETRVIVREGRVALRGNEAQSASVELTANQMSICRKQEAPETPRAIEAQYALGWLEGRIVFDQASLAEVVAELQRVYNVEIVLAKPSLAQNTITGSFNRKPVESVLASICLTLNLQYRREAGRYVVSE